MQRADFTSKSSDQLEGDNLSYEEYWFNKGEAFYQQGDLDQAYIAYQNVLSRDNSHLNAKIKTGVVLIDQKHYDLAIKSFDEVLLIDPNNKEALFNNGMAYAFLRDYQNAVQSFISVEPKDSLVFFQIAKAYAKLGDNDQALEYYDLALAEIPNEDKNIERRNKILEDRANLYIKLNKFDEAIDDFTAIIDSQAQGVNTDPETLSWIFLGRGRCYATLKNYELAMADFEISLIHKESNAAYVNLGLVAKNIGLSNPNDKEKKFAEAEAYYKKALTINFALTSKSGIADLLQRIAKLYPDDDRKSNNLRELYEKNAKLLIEVQKALEKKDTKSALFKLDQLIKNGFVEAYFYRAEVNATLGKDKEAIEDYEEYKKDHPEDPIVYIRLAELKLNHKEMDEAGLKDLDIAFGLLPKESPILDTLYDLRAKGYTGLGDYEQAIEDFTKILDNSSLKDPIVLQCRAMAYKANGDVQLADNDRKAAGDIYFSRGAAAMWRKDINEAYFNLGKAIDLGSEEAHIFRIELGMAMIKKLTNENAKQNAKSISKFSDQVLSDCQSLLAIDPDNSKVHFQLGFISIHRDAEYAKLCFSECIEHTDDNALKIAAYINRAKLNEDTNQYDKAKEDYKEVLKLDPTNSKALAGLNPKPSSKPSSSWNPFSWYNRTKPQPETQDKPGPTQKKPG